MKVCKFGGSSVADDIQVAKIRDIVLSDPTRRVVVVSAPGKRNKSDTKVTDMLIALAETALAGLDTEAALAAVVERYAIIARGLKVDERVLDEVEQDLRARLALDKSNPGRFMDAMKAAGEDNSARVVAAAFRAAGVEADYVSPRDSGMLLTDEFGAAQLLNESYANLHDYLSKIDAIVIYPGFFGYTKNGDVATFPRGGSDITGAILAAALRADVYENFTDVDNVYPVDPRLVPEVKEGIAEMTYREMRELSYAGFGVFQDEAVIPVVHAGIPINIRNTNHPDAPGTMVVRHRVSTQGSVVGIASDSGFCNIFLDKYMMNREVGFGRRLLQILEEEGVSYEHMPSGIDNISVIVREKSFPVEVERRVVDRIAYELKPDNLQIERGYALVMVVGEGLYYTPGIAARATKALADAGVNIEMMNQGSSEISMMFGVRTDLRKKAVCALYDAFIRTGSHESAGQQD
ncbi:MAG: aspartate kinase [Kiritimatiellia bacterium]